MPADVLNHIEGTLAGIRDDGLYEVERVIAGPQGARIDILSDGATHPAVSLCANNCLGLADDHDIIAVAKTALDEFGFGIASVRFICGAPALHRALGQRIALC